MLNITVNTVIRLGFSQNVEAYGVSPVALECLIYSPLLSEPYIYTRRIARETVASQVRSPSYSWGQRVRHINYGECYYFQPITVADVDNLDAVLACDHFNQVSIHITSPPPPPTHTHAHARACACACTYMNVCDNNNDAVV